MEWIGNIWDLIILNPVINVLIMLSSYLGGSFGLTIIVLTIVVNLAMYPLTLKQLKASKAMQDIQAQVAEVRAKAVSAANPIGVERGKRMTSMASSAIAMVRIKTRIQYLIDCAER